MNTGFTVWDIATGRIVSSGICPMEMVAIQAGDGQDYIDEEYDGGVCWMPGGVPQDRPPRPVIAAAAVAGQVVPMTGIMPGASVTLIDSFGVAHTYDHDPADPLILIDPGTYEIRVRQAFPHHNAYRTIEVSDA